MNDLFGFTSYLDDRFFVASVQAPFSLDFGGFAWFELYFEGGQVTGFNRKHFEQSLQLLDEFIDELIAEHDLDTDRIYIGGFSQGSMISVSSVFSKPETFAGAVLMSGRASNEMIVEENIAKLKDFPFFVSHGTLDPVIPIEHGRATKEILSRMPVELVYKEYVMAHEISRETVIDLTVWLSSQLD